MLSLKRVTKNWEPVWAYFAPYHYFINESRSSLNPAAFKFLVYEETTVIGFAASLPQPSGTLRYAWKSHKTVTLPEFDHRWMDVADFVAQFHINEGKRWFSQAPETYAIYRESSPLWKPTSKHDPPKKFSHEYIGTKVLSVAETVEA